MKRTHLPLNALRVFDAAARHLSFTRAADELAVTPAAVGQQIRALEDVLGVVLFRRTSKGLELTERGRGRPRCLARRLPPFRGERAGDAGGPVLLQLCHRRPARILCAMAGAAPCGLPRGQSRYPLSRSPPARMPTSPRPTSIWPCGWWKGRGNWKACSWNPASAWWWRPPARPMAGSAGPTFEAPDGREDHPARGQRRTGAQLRAGRPWPRNAAAAAGGRGAGRGRLEAIGEPEPCRRAYWLIAPRPQWRQKKVKALVEYLVGDKG